MSDWMPIDTAPKDGTTILIFGAYSSDWDDYSESKKIGIMCAAWKYDESIHEGYWTPMPENRYVSDVQPIHWMPLPAPRLY